MPVMEGKAMLFKEFAGVNAFPICLATQDVEEIVRTVKYLAPVFGGVNLEDIAAPRCFEIEQRLKAETDIPIFHDDQHGTAIVSLAALFNALKLVKKDLQSVKIVINGAGAAGVRSPNYSGKQGQRIFGCVTLRALFPASGIISPPKSEPLPWPPLVPSPRRCRMQIFSLG